MTSVITRPMIGVSPTVEELRLAYRVPAEVMELALPLLPLIAPDVAPPIAYRAGDEPPRFVRVPAGDLVEAAVREASREGLRDGRTGLIAPGEILDRIEPLLPRPDIAFDELAAPIQALTPRAAKGLEFDRVVLVEPARIAAGGVDGLCALYVALTRPTKTLVVVHAERCPSSSGRPGPTSASGVLACPSRRASRDLDACPRARTAHRARGDRRPVRRRSAARAGRT
jgi:hypothetical protein